MADNLARVFPDRRDPMRVVHSLVDMFRSRMFAICCDYEDADDLDHLRSDPVFTLACGPLPDTSHDLRSQPTLWRLENAPRLRDVIRLTYTLVDAWMDSYPREPASVTLDQAENLIKLHKTQLTSDRTSCRSALAIQVRLALHTAAYWLMLTVRDTIPKARELATAEFATLRHRLLKIAAPVVETTSRIRFAFAAACPEADLFRGLPGALLPLGP